MIQRIKGVKRCERQNVYEQSGGGFSGEKRNLFNDSPPSKIFVFSDIMRRSNLFGGWYLILRFFPPLSRVGSHTPVIIVPCYVLTRYFGRYIYAYVCPKRHIVFIGNTHAQSIGGH